MKKKKLKVLVDMSATILHHGHINLLKKASKYGSVIVALTKDKEIFNCKGFHPELNFSQRSKILKSIKYVSRVIPSNWNIDNKFIKKYKIDILVHGSDNFNAAMNVKIKTFPRTVGISSSKLRKKIFNTFKKKKK